MAKTKMQINSVPVKPTSYEPLSEYSWQRHGQSRPSNSRRWEKRTRKRSVRLWNKRESIRLLDQAVVDERLDAEQEELERELSGFYDDMYPNNEYDYYGGEYDYDEDVHDGVYYGNEAMDAQDYRYAMEMERFNDYEDDDNDYSYGTYEDRYGYNEYCQCCGDYH